MIEIKLPERFERDSLSTFFSLLEKTANEHVVKVDFSSLRYSKPTAMLVAGSRLRDWVRYRHGKGFTSIKAGIDPNKRVHSYLMHLGFFNFIYMEKGNIIGQAKGNNKYLPITRVARPEFNPFDQPLTDWYESIRYESKRLATILSAGNNQCISIYTYAIREIIRNVFEHSKAKECFICGQRWANGTVEIAVIDEGVGISSTLREAYRITGDDEALELAVKPGVSRTNNKPESNNVFDNSGFGLYILSEIGKRYGWYALGSGTSKIIGANNICSLEEFSFNGTFFGISIDRPITNFPYILNEIIKTGEEASGKQGVAKKASGMSKILDF
jgi:hypothetical protein